MNSGTVDRARCSKGGSIFTHGRMDLGLLLDASKWVTSSSFNKAKAFIKDIINCFQYGPGKTRVTVISYAANGGAKVEISFKQSETTSKADMLKIVDGIKYRNGALDTMGGLQALKKAFNDNKRDPKLSGGLYKAAFVITDGKAVGKEGETVPVAAQQVDLAFAFDVTMSMGLAIDNAKTKMLQMVADLKQTFKSLKLRVGVVAYRDNGDKKHFEILEFTNNEAKFQNFLNILAPAGGGDYPEDLLGAMKIINKWKWTSSTKMLVGITDAEHRGDFSDKRSNSYTTAESLFYDFKCKKGLNHFLLLRTSQRVELTRMSKAFDKIGAQRCGKSGFKPGKEKFFYEGPLVKSEQIAAFLNGKLRTAVTSLSGIAGELHAMGIDMLGAGLSANADYAKLNQILRMSRRKHTGSSSPLIKIKKGESFVADKVRTTFKSLMLQEINMCRASPCGKGNVCEAAGKGAFRCCCAPGLEGPTCEVKRCPKCRVEALVQAITKPDFFVPKCTPTGAFEPKQCHGKDCFCVDNDGHEIKKTRRLARIQIDCSKYAVAPVRLSNCEEKAAAGKAKNFPMTTSCDQDGMFKEVQCMASFCWCSQPNGKHLPNTFFNKKDNDAPECAKEVAIKPDCSQATKDGFLSHPFDCARYIRCTPQRIFICSCPEGQSFHLGKGRCEHSSDVEC